MPVWPRGHYKLGSQVILLADAVDIREDLLVRAQPVLDALNTSLEETVHLAVLQGDEMITLMKREALHALRIDSGSIGKSTALHATATGKILLAGLDDGEVRRIMAVHGLRKFTPKTCTDIAALLDDLQAVRKRGYSTDYEEFQRYVICIGAPIYDAQGNVMAAISVSTPINRATDEHLERVQREVLSAARELSISNIEPIVAEVEQRKAAKHSII